jgi:RHS repeat-associated protein
VRPPFKLSDAVTGQAYWTAEARDAELHLTKHTAGNGVATIQTFDPNTGQLTDIIAGSEGKVLRHTYTYDLLGKLITRADANTSLSESFEYDTLNRLTKSTVSLTPTPWVQTVAYNAIGNITHKSDVGTYSYPSPGSPKPHGVTSISGGVINTTFTYDAKGNMTSGNGLTLTYTSYNKTETIKRGTTEIAFAHDTEHNRYSQLGPTGETLYLTGPGVFAERHAGIGSGEVRWTNYLIIGGRLIGVYIEKADETVVTRYFHTDHLGSISVISNEAGAAVERLSYDAWGKRRHPNGEPDPAGSITSEESRGFTGHEQLDSVGLIHMNGRVYDPLLGRFGSPDPMTEDPFSSQGWNRYSYVGNSPVNFTDPSGYCFMGCFWQPAFRAIGTFFRQNWRAILNITVTGLCNLTPAAGPGCAALGSFVAGMTSGDLGQALKGAVIAYVTAPAFKVVGDSFRSGSLGNVAGHAIVGCASSVAGGGRCGPGALSGAVGSLASAITRGQSFGFRLVANSAFGGLASVAGGGNFANGAVTSAYGHLFNECIHDGCNDDPFAEPKIPAAPPGVDIEENVALVRRMRLWYAIPRGIEDLLGVRTMEYETWFYNQVKAEGPWDFKFHYGAKYEDFGNYHYGMVAAAAGFNDFVIYNEAGRAQTVAPKDGSFGYPASRWSYIFGGFGGKFPYGDDPWDRYWISRGIRDFRKK